MKIVREYQPRDNGSRRVIVDLKPGEVLCAVVENSHYRLAQPVDDVVASHIIADAQKVVWCSASQEWVAA